MRTILLWLAARFGVELQALPPSSPLAEAETVRGAPHELMVNPDGSPHAHGRMQLAMVRDIARCTLLLAQVHKGLPPVTVAERVAEFWYGR
jgi:hypothetical protein